MPVPSRFASGDIEFVLNDILSKKIWLYWMCEADGPGLKTIFSQSIVNFLLLVNWREWAVFWFGVVNLMELS